MGHRKRAAEIKERAAEIFSVLKSVPAKACSKKCTAGSKVLGEENIIYVYMGELLDILVRKKS